MIYLLQYTQQDGTTKSHLLDATEAEPAANEAALLHVLHSSTASTLWSISDAGKATSAPVQKEIVERIEKERSIALAEAQAERARIEERALEKALEVLKASQASNEEKRAQVEALLKELDFG